MTLRAGIVTFPGSNCDRDMLTTLNSFFPVTAELLWHADRFSNRYDLLIVPGGFSYGDYLRCGAIARFAPAMKDVVEHRKRGGIVFGVCNGFQILCEAGLLPGALVKNAGLKHVCRDITLKAGLGNAFTRGLEGRAFVIPVSHGEGNYRVDNETLARMKDCRQIAFTYVDNPNGALEDIAGVTDEEHKVLGMMPHPERAVDPITGGKDGRPILEAVLEACMSHAGV